MVRNGAIYTLHTDHLGRPEKATDAAGATVWSIQANAWDSDAATGSLTVNLRFPGQYYDAESGLYYNYHRFYDPVTGRYVSSDPIGLGGGMNRYAYAGSNPARYIDPLGLVAYSGSSNPLVFNLDNDSNRAPGVAGSCPIEKRFGRFISSPESRLPTRQYSPAPENNPSFDYYAGSVPDDPLVKLAEREVVAVTAAIGAAAVATCVSSGACASTAILIRTGAERAATTASSATTRAYVEVQISANSLSAAARANLPAAHYHLSHFAKGLAAGYKHQEFGYVNVTPTAPVSEKLGYGAGYLYQVMNKTKTLPRP